MNHQRVIWRQFSVFLKRKLHAMGYWNRNFIEICRNQYYCTEKPTLIHTNEVTSLFLLTIEASKHILIVIPSKEGAEKDVALKKVILQHPEER